MGKLPLSILAAENTCTEGPQSPVLVFFLDEEGNVVIASTEGNHSDGDVLIHALCDALLGALALGDIGHHFPDTSEEFRGIDSRILLRRVAALIAENGWKTVNADMTLALQRPKVAGFVAQMRENIAADLGVDTGCVSVKATTTEHLGFCGREEGVEAYATVLVGR